MLIRRFQKRDLLQVVELWHESKRRAFPYVAAQQAYTMDDDRRYFEGSLIKRCQVWIAEEEGEIVGFLALEEDLIDLLFVKVGRQRLGVGTALMAEARRQRPAGLRAYTFQKNIAGRSFFEKHDFEVVGAGLSPEPEKEPDFEYAWKPAR